MFHVAHYIFFISTVRKNIKSYNYIPHLAGVGPQAALGGKALATDVAVEGAVFEPLC